MTNIPCPFCNSDQLELVDLSSDDAEGFHVKCLNCNSCGPHENGADANRANELWNDQMHCKY